MERCLKNPRQLLPGGKPRGLWAHSARSLRQAWNNAKGDPPSEQAMKSTQLDKLGGLVLEEDIELISLLGEGGMGVVYRAWQRSLKRELCIKFLRANLLSSKEWVERFRREAKALSKMNNPHIVNVYFVSIFQNVYPYMGMELVEGVSLRQAIDADTRLEWRRACRIVLQICDAMSKVHEAGLVHRDLKPDNIVLSYLPEPDFVKILDFGLCTPLPQGATLTEQNDLLGSVHYMAPECFQRSQRQPAVDIYAIGCLFFEALVGRPPFQARDMIGIAYKHGHEMLPPILPVVANAAVNESLTAFLKKACAKSPVDRFRNCSEMSTCLRSILAETVADTVVGQLLKSPGVQVPVAGSKLWKQIAPLVAVAMLITTMAMMHSSKRFSQTARFGGSSSLAEKDLPVRSSDILSATQVELAEGKPEQAAVSITRVVSLLKSEVCASTNPASKESVSEINKVFDVLSKSPNNLKGPGQELDRPLISYVTMHGLTKLERDLMDVLANTLHRRSLYEGSSFAGEVDTLLSAIEFRRREYDEASRFLFAITGASEKRDFVNEQVVLLSSDAPGSDEEKRNRFLQLCLKLAPFDQSTSKKSLLLYRVLSKNTFEQSELQNFIRFLELSESLHYLDNHSPSIWELAEFNKLKLKTAPISLKEDLRKALVPLVRQSAREHGIDISYDLYLSVDSDESLHVAGLMVQDAALVVNGMIKAERYREGFAAIETLLATKLWKKITQSKNFGNLAVAKFYPVIALEDEICDLVKAPKNQLSRSENHQLLRQWYQIARQFFDDFLGVDRLLRWFAAAKAVDLTAINDDLSFVTTICHSKLPIMERGGLVCLFVAEGHERRVFEGTPHGGECAACEAFRIWCLYVVADLHRRQPEMPLSGAIHFQSHCLNAGLHAESESLFKFLHKEVLSRGTVQEKFFHYLYGFRTAILMSKFGEAKIRCRLALELLPKLRKGHSAPEAEVERARSLFAQGHEEQATEIMKTRINECIEQATRRSKSTKTISTQSAKEQSDRGWSMTFLLCEMSLKNAERSDIPRAMFNSSLAWQAFCLP